MTAPASKFRVPRKYVLVLDRPDGSLSELAEGLKPLGFDVVRARNCAVAMHHIATSPLLSLVSVFVDETSDRATAASLVTELRRRGMSIPVMWASAPGSSEEDLPEGCIRLSASDGLTSADLQRTLGPMLRETLYAPWIVETLAVAAEQTMRDAFATEATADEPFLKANTVSIGDVRASIGFGSHRFRGYMLVSGERDSFDRMWRRVFGGAAPNSVDSLADMAGEICNQILGRMAPRLGTKIDPVKPSMPMLLIGSELVMRAKSPKPTLIFPLRYEREMFYVAFCVDRCDLDKPVDEEEENLQSGDLVFL